MWGRINEKSFLNGLCTSFIKCAKSYQDKQNLLQLMHGKTSFISKKILAQVRVNKFIAQLLFVKEIKVNFCWINYREENVQSFFLSLPK